MRRARSVDGRLSTYNYSFYNPRGHRMWPCAVAWRERVGRVAEFENLAAKHLNLIRYLNIFSSTVCVGRVLIFYRFIFIFTDIYLYRYNFLQAYNFHVGILCFVV